VLQRGAAHVREGRGAAEHAWGDADTAFLVLTTRLAIGDPSLVHSAWVMLAERMMRDRAAAAASPAVPRGSAGAAALRALTADRAVWLPEQLNAAVAKTLRD
jgi:hypothetical protein